MTLLLTLLLSFVVVLFSVFAMAIGAVAWNRPIRGSCGGVSGDGCELCGGDQDKCPG